MRGIQATIRRDEDCAAIAQQLSVARSALDKACRRTLTWLIEEALLDPEQSAAASLPRVCEVFTRPP